MKNEGKFQFLKLYFHGKVKKNKKGENVKLEFLLPNDHCKKKHFRFGKCRRDKEVSGKSGRKKIPLLLSKEQSLYSNVKITYLSVTGYNSKYC